VRRARHAWPGTSDADASDQRRLRPLLLAREEGVPPVPSCPRPVLRATVSPSLCVALWLALCLSLCLRLLAEPAPAHAAARPKQAPAVLAIVYGERVLRGEAESALAGDHVGHPWALRQSVAEAVDLRLALRGLPKAVAEQLAAHADTLAAEAEAHQGGRAAWTAQLAALGQSAAGWRRMMLTRLAVAAQLPAGATAVGEEAIADRYKRRWGRFVVPAQALLSEIAVPLSSDATADVEHARAVVLAANERLERGEPFAAVAKVLSQTPDAGRGGDRGWVGEDVLDVALRAALQALEPGQRTRPVQSAWGMHVLLLRERKPQRKLSLAEARPLVIAQLAAERGHVARRQWLDAARAAADSAGHLRWMTPK